MAIAIILPKLDEAMLTGKIVKWIKKEGDRVEKGDVILEIETEKVTFEIESEGSGLLSKLMAQEGEDVPVGKTVAYILQPGEKMPEVQESTPAVEIKSGVEATEVPVEIRKVKISPVARKIAREHNIDFATVKGTGPGGRIIREDVLKAVEESKVPAIQPVQPQPESAEEQVVQLSSMRKVIARRMTESFQSPHFYLTVEVETQELSKTNRQLIPIMERKLGIRSTITDLIIMMTAKALENNPPMNCSYIDDSIRLFKQIDIGLVASVEGGLVVPVIRQANKKSLEEITRTRADLVKKARDGKLTMAEMKGSSFTISNLGMYGIDQFSAILQPPEAAILAVGRIADKAVVRDGQIVIRPMMILTLSIDHRVLDGVVGSQFLQSLKSYIENPVLCLT